MQKWFLSTRRSYSLPEEWRLCLNRAVRQDHYSCSGNWPPLAVDLFLLVGAVMVMCSWGGFVNYSAARQWPKTSKNLLWSFFFTEAGVEQKTGFRTPRIWCDIRVWGQYSNRGTKRPRTFGKPVLLVVAPARTLSHSPSFPTFLGVKNNMDMLKMVHIVLEFPTKFWIWRTIWTIFNTILGQEIAKTLWTKRRREPAARCT